MRRSLSLCDDTTAYTCCDSQLRNGIKPYSLEFNAIAPQDTNETIAFQVKARDSGDGLSFALGGQSDMLLRTKIWAVPTVSITVMKSALKPVTTKTTLRKKREKQCSTLGTQSGSMYTTSIVLCKLCFR